MNAKIQPPPTSMKYYQSDANFRGSYAVCTAVCMHVIFFPISLSCVETGEPSHVCHTHDIDKCFYRIMLLKFLPSRAWTQSNSFYNSFFVSGANVAGLKAFFPGEWDDGFIAGCRRQLSATPLAQLLFVGLYECGIWGWASSAQQHLLIVIRVTKWAQ